MSKTCFVLAGGLIASSMGYTADWAKEKIRESIWDLWLYLISLGVGIVSHPIVMFTLVSWFAFKVVTLPGSSDKECDVEVGENDLDPMSGTEQPIES